MDVHMITWRDELVARQRHEDLLTKSLENYQISEMLGEGKKKGRKDSIITRGLHSLGERLVITGVRLQLLNPLLNSASKGG